MARPFPANIPVKFSFSAFPVTSLFILMAILAVLSMVTFSCASHKPTKSSREKNEKSIQLGGKKNNRLAKLQSNLSSKALLMGKMISWKKVGDEGVEEEEGFDMDDDAFWRRAILMGDRCRPLEFSGKISYDSDGNLLPDSPHRKNGN